MYQGIIGLLEKDSNGFFKINRSTYGNIIPKDLQYLKRVISKDVRFKKFKSEEIGILRFLRSSNISTIVEPLKTSEKQKPIAVIEGIRKVEPVIEQSVRTMSDEFIMNVPFADSDMKKIRRDVIWLT